MKQVFKETLVYRVLMVCKVPKVSKEHKELLVFKVILVLKV